MFAPQTLTNVFLSITIVCGFLHTETGVNAFDCSDSDKTIRLKRETVCSSLTQGNTSWCGDSWKNVTAHEDWPNQAVYMQQLIVELTATSTPCLTTQYVHDTVRWLNESQAEPSVSGSWMWTYLVFQPQYYEQPRKPGARIESPATLGRKCWAFAYLKQEWASTSAPFVNALATANQSVPQFVSEYNYAIPLTMMLCHKVMMSCFVNATPTPATCPSKILEFKAGFERENALRDFVVKYPF
eukprot:m.48049 g.48049  ORF g.48049 m.48049 type:complete len:241 (-) comp20652_c0_seq1:116-838(-)